MAVNLKTLDFSVLSEFLVGTVRCLWFGSHPGSLERIDMIPILAAALIPVQMEFSVGTRLRIHESEGFRSRSG